MSPVPGRSTLITSAPNQARSCVQVGPDCTWVKSRMRTPSSALPACPNGLVEGLLVKVLGRPFVCATLPDLPDGFATLAMLRTVDATAAAALPIALFFGFARAVTLGLERSGFFAAGLDFAVLAIERLRCSFISCESCFAG